MDVYLAGPITGLTYDDGADWRERAVEELAKDGITAWSPLRAKEHLRQYGVLDDYAEQEYFKHVLSSPRGIMTRDRWDATRADILLVNFAGAERVSVGSVMEVAWADANRIPIVCVMEAEGNVHDHPMVREALGYVVPTLEEGLTVIRALALPSRASVSA